MNNMKLLRYIILFNLIFVAHLAYAQNLLEFNQFTSSKEILNPAFSGFGNKRVLNFGSRQQWTGVDGAPQIFFLSGHSPLKRNSTKKLTYSHNSLRISTPKIYQRIYQSQLKRASKKVKHGIGARVYADKQGHFQNWNAGLSYALHLPLTDTWRLSVGTTLGFHYLEASRDIQVRNPDNDQTAQAYMNGSPEKRFNLQLGASLHTETFYLGYSILNLASISILSEGLEEDSDLIQHVFMTGLNLSVHRHFTLSPELLAYYGTNQELGYNMSVKGMYKEIGYAGLSWKSNNYLGMLFGFRVTKKLQFNYAYEIPFSEIKEISEPTGSHEAILSFIF